MSVSQWMLLSIVGIIVMLLGGWEWFFGKRFQRFRAGAASAESDESFRLMIEGIKDYAIIRLDTGGRITSWNGGAERFKGYRAEEIIGQHFSRFYPKEDVENGKPEMELEVASQQGRFEEEGWRVRKDGSLFWASVVLTALYGPSGQLRGFAKVTRDLTERKREERDLQWKTALLEAQIQSSPDGIIVINNKQEKIIQNRKLNELWNIPREMGDDPEISEQIRWVESTTREPAKFQEMVRRFKSHPEETSHSELEFKDGRILDRYSAPVIGKKGEHFGRISIFRDITDQSRARKELEESRLLLDGVLRNSIDGVVAYESIRDESGELVDFRFLLVNPAAEQLLGRPASALIGKGLLETSLDIVLEGLFESFVRVVEEKNVDFEYSAIRSGVLRWYRVAGAKLGDGLVMTYSDITERKQTTEQLNRMFQLSLDIMCTVDLEGRIQRVNPAGERILGHPKKELMDQPFMNFVHPDDRAKSAEEMARVIAGQITTGFEMRCRHRDGSYKWIQWNSIGRPEEALFYATGRDITERKHFEARLFQSQKMETVGKLAGGVAHEFNSILTAILGQSDLLLLDLPAGSPLAKSASEINKAADRAATLTRQLLAYGRKQILQPAILDLNVVVSEMLRTLQHLTGKDVDVNIAPSAGLSKVKIDPGQMEQVIVNMAMNAADAMPNGGKLTLETANVTLGEEFVRPFPDLKAGDYVMLAITDTGVGMTDEVKTRAFEPFYSTKGIGQGTGLGLATCYGILKQSGGHINIYSEVARGTTFKIYLPEVEETTKDRSPPPKPSDLPRGTETILLVEDDPSLREMSAVLLTRLGYTVFTATNGVEALSLKQKRGIGHIDLLFTDVVMPHMSGQELSDRVRAIYPHTKILFTSAYTESAIVHNGVLNEGVILLQKPFTPSALATKVREVLDLPPSFPA